MPQSFSRRWLDIPGTVAARLESRSSRTGSLAREDECRQSSAARRRSFVGGTKKSGVHDALKDESPALLHELQRLEFKLNVLLRLTAELAVRNHALPPARHVRLSSSGLEWTGFRSATRGRDRHTVGPISILRCRNLSKYPAPSRAIESKKASALRSFGSAGLSDSVVDLLEKLIFRTPSPLDRWRPPRGYLIPLFRFLARF